MNREALYLQHVLDAIGKIERYVAVGYAEFIARAHWQDAVIRQLEIIGEAVKRGDGDPQAVLESDHVPTGRSGPL